jgi:flagellar biosynthesis/type III secretory pathway ATPase
LIDYPEQGKEIALRHAKYFTHEGAERLFTDFAESIEAYAKAYGEIAEAAWSERKASRNNQPLSAEKKVVGRHG